MKKAYKIGIIAVICVALLGVCFLWQRGKAIPLSKEDSKETSELTDLEDGETPLDTTLSEDEEEAVSADTQTTVSQNGTDTKSENATVVTSGTQGSQTQTEETKTGTDGETDTSTTQTEGTGSDGEDPSEKTEAEGTAIELPMVQLHP